MAERVNITAHPSQMSLAKVDSNVLLELFPFAITLDHDMRIAKCGEKLLETWILQNPHRKPATFFQSPVTTHLKLRRPKGIEFKWSTVVQMHNVIFELELIRADDPRVDEIDDGFLEITQNMSLSDSDGTSEADAIAPEDIPDATGVGGKDDDKVARGTQSIYRLLLKGQMRFIADIDSIVFLCSPV